MYCNKCGAQLNEGAQFCTNCGSKLNAAAPQGPAVYQQPNYVATQQQSKAVAALVLGIIGMITWLLPIIGLPVTIVGLVLSINGTKNKKAFATPALVLSIIGLALSVINAVAGAMMGLNGMF